MDTGEIDTGEQRVHPFGRSLRPAVVAIVVSALAISGIALASGDDRRELSSSGSAPSDVLAVDSAVSDTAPAPTDPAGAPSPLVDTAPTPADPGTSLPDTSPVESATAETATVETATPVTTPRGAVPILEATAFAVYDVTSGRWLAENNADAPVPVGSVMKLLTSYVVLDQGDLARTVTVPKLEVDISESAIGLYQGEQLPRDVLLRAMLIVSANDAARALAIDAGGTIDGFVAKMNAAAAELGLSNTVAANPIGLDAAGAYSSARDMIELAALLMQDPTFSAAVAKTSANLHGQTFPATNDLLTAYDGATGVKTGHTTQAGYCLVGSATRAGRSYIVAVFGAPTDAARLAAATALLDWAFSG